MEEIKLIWDFKGPSSKHTSAHFKTHLLEFFKEEKLEYYSCEVETVNESYHYTFVITNKSNLALIKTALKPNRGQLVKAG